MQKSNYNSNRQDKQRKFFNSRPVFTETSKEITPEEREQALKNLNSLIAKTRKDLQ
jgi:hypothetical protein